MKRNFAVMSLLLAGCILSGCGGEKTPEPAPTPAPPVTAPETPAVSAPETPGETVKELTAEEQAAVIAEQYARLSDGKEMIFLTDLDGNGRMELILQDPDFAVYEISPAGTLELAGSYTAEEGVPMLLTNQPYLVLRDLQGINHYLISGYSSTDHSYREDVSDYMLDNGDLLRQYVCSSEYDYSTESESGYTAAGVETDRDAFYLSTWEYTEAVKEETWVMNCCGSFVEDLKDLSGSALQDALTQMWEKFSLEPVELPYWYDDLEGQWRLVAGEVEGCEFEVEGEGETYLTFYGGYVDYEDYVPGLGNQIRENLPVSLCLGASYGNDLWYVDICDTDLLRYTTANINDDGRLCMMAQNIYSESDYASVVWYFEKL